MTITTKDLHNMAQQGARMNIKLTNDDLLPTLIVSTEDNQLGIYGVGGSKDEIPHIVFHKLQECNAKAYAFVTEAWATSFFEEVQKYDRVRDMPPDDRYEMVQIILVEKNKGIVGGSNARIDRPKTNTKTLGPWTDMDDFKLTSGYYVTEW
jgi:hypothetical protein